MTNKTDDNIQTGRLVKCVVPVSGGKDSQVCAKLAVEKYGPDSVVGLFCDTQFEHPITYEHINKIADLYGIKIYRVSSGSVELQVRKHKRFPGGGARFCTEELKIWPAKRFYNDFAIGNGPFEVWYGMRSEESHARKKRYEGVIDTELYKPHEIISKYPKKLHALGCSFRLPIINWSEREVFEYLDGEENPLYQAGFTRVGCFPCLAAGDKHKEKAFGFDEFGRHNFLTVRDLEQITGYSIFTSEGGQLRNDSGQMDLFAGCALCSI